MISERQNRVLHLDMRFQDLQGIIRARASSPEMRGVAGGSTGLMRRSIVAFTQRDGRVAQYNYRLDTALLGAHMSGVGLRTQPARGPATVGERFYRPAVPAR
jgi:hypothetical protein